MDKNIKSFVISSLRRTSYKFKPRNDALKNAKVSYGKYQCNICKLIFSRKDIALDHIVPVVGESGFTTWDDYINRMFVDVNGWQVLCNNGENSCHAIKTRKENEIRKINRKKVSNKLTNVTKRRKVNKKGAIKHVAKRSKN